MTSFNLMFHSFITLFLVTLIGCSKAKSSGCSANPLIPERPFVVVWNHPTRQCEDSGVHLDFHKWGIIDNDKDRFFGQKIVLLYNLGKWPYYSKDGQSVNGGLPQLADLNAHLAKVDTDLKTNVWNNSFNGLAVIDMEHWRPLYWTNFDSLKIYQEKSLALAKQKFPHYDKTQLKNEAIKEFDTAARQMMEETLIKVTTKRKTGKWGYYLYPRCWDKKNCNTTTISNNDRMSWVFEKSTGLYPSIYFKLDEPPVSRGQRIKNILHEAMRVKAKYSPQDAPVMPYSKNQDGPYHMFQKLDMSYSILEPANIGSSGIVLWGSSNDARAKNECLILQDYIENKLGPYSLNVMNFFGNCTQQLCNSHGRCVRKDYERTYQYYLRESGRKECLISEEQLTTLKKGHSTRKRNRQSTFLQFLKKYMSHRKGFHSDGLYQMTINSNDRSFKDNHDLKISHSLEETHRGHKSTFIKRLKYSPFNSHKKLKTRNGKNSLEKTRKASQIDQEDSSSFPDFENGAPDYDFDDYVCKCFLGYSGTHCEKSQN